MVSVFIVEVKALRYLESVLKPEQLYQKKNGLIAQVKSWCKWPRIDSLIDIKLAGERLGTSSCIRNWTGRSEITAI